MAFRGFLFSQLMKQVLILGLFAMAGCEVVTIKAISDYYTNGNDNKSSKGTDQDAGPTGTVPVIGNLNNYLLPLSSANTAIKTGSTLTLTPSYSDPNGDVIDPNSWTCTYLTMGLDTSDGNYVAAETNCDSLSSITTINSSRIPGSLADDSTTSKFDVATGEFVWTPSATSVGTYRLTFKVRDVTAEEGSRVIYVTVMPNYHTSSSLSLYYDPTFSLGLGSNQYGPRIDASGDDNITESWGELSNSALSVSANIGGFTLPNPWMGTGAHSSLDPYRLGFGGADYLSFGAGLNTATNLSVSTWIYPTSVATAGATILSNSDGASAGFILQQSAKSPQVLELAVGNYTGTYSAAVLADSPIAYWRLGDTPYTNGGTISDTSGANTCSGSPCHATLTDFLGSPVTGEAGGLTSESNTAIHLLWGDRIIAPHIFNPAATSWSSEIWLKTDFNNTNNYYGALSIAPGTGSASEFLMAHHQLAWSLYSQFGGVKQFVGIVPQADVWYHIVQTYNNATNVYKWYVNGVMTSSGTMNPGNNTDGSFIIGTNSAEGWSPAWQGPMHDVALYGGELTAAQVQRHYHAGARCRGRTKLVNNTWNHVGVNFDGTTATLLVNGQADCRSNPGLSSSGSAANLVLGRRAISNNNYWSGNLGPVLIASSTGAATTSAGNLYMDFLKTFDNFNVHKFGEIVTSNLILHWDASVSKNGAIPHSNTCGQDTAMWLDISGHNNHGAAEMFSDPTGCDATHGWNGAGTLANPYKVDLTGQNHLFRLDHMRSTNKTYTFEFWFKNGNNNSDWQWLFDSPNLTLYYSDLISVDGNFGFRDVAYSGNAIDNKNIGASFTDSTWHHIVYVMDAAATTGSIYIDGTLLGSASYTGRDLIGEMAFFGRRADNSWGFYDAEAAIVRLYEAALTPAQIKQNCHAQVARFQGASCAAP